MDPSVQGHTERYMGHFHSYLTFHQEKPIKSVNCLVEGEKHMSDYHLHVTEMSLLDSLFEQAGHNS